jgi:hypothetical protein
MQLVQEEVQQPFDLSQEPLLRATLLHLGEDEHLLLLTVHHIIMDAWSKGVLFQELAALYESFSSWKAVTPPRTARTVCRFCGLATPMATGRVFRGAAGLLEAAAWQQPLRTTATN